MYHFLITFSLFTCLMMSSSIAQNSKDVTIKWGSPVSHFFESEEVKALSFDGAFYNLHESSPAAGEKCPITASIEMQHGKPIPLSNFLDFLLLKTFNNSASMNVSTSPQIVDTSAPSTQREIALSRAAIKKKNEIQSTKEKKKNKNSSY